MKPAVIILAQTLHGQDGLSCLARQFTQAVAAAIEEPIEVVVLAAGDGEFDPPPNAVVTDCGGSRAQFVRRLMQASAAAQLPRLVLCLHAHLLPAAWPLVQRGVPLVPVCVGIEVWKPLSWARRKVFARASRAIAISLHSADRFRTANPLLAALPLDICHPATPALAVPAPPRPDAGEPFALIVGRMAAEERYKGHDALIDVWPEVLSRAPGARLVMAGGGDDRERLRQRVRDADLEAFITLPGPQSPAALAALYRDCAFVTLPSRNEGFGYVLLEAMSTGRACIAARGAPEEIVQHGITGMIVDADDPRSLAASHALLFSDPEACAALGHAGRERAATEFSMERFTRDVSRTLAAVLPAGLAAPC